MGELTPNAEAEIVEIWPLAVTATTPPTPEFRQAPFGGGTLWATPLGAMFAVTEPSPSLGGPTAQESQQKARHTVSSPFLTTDQAAKRIGFTKAKLSRSCGSPGADRRSCASLHAAVLYDADKFDAWVRANEFRSTSEYAGDRDAA